MFLRKCLPTCAALLLMAAGAGDLDARELRVISGFQANYLWKVEVLDPFLEEIAKNTDGQLSFRVNGPDTVPTYEQLQPTQAGVFDVLFTHPAYHSGTTAVGMAIDAIKPDPAKRREIGVFDEIATYYRTKQGLELVAAPPIGSQGFRYYLRSPIKEDPGLKGMKIRGTASYFPMIRALGGAPVNLAGGEIYTALERGTIDGAAWPTTGVIDFKIHEVAKYYTNPTFGQVGTMIFFNSATWESLTQEQRDIILEAGRRVEEKSALLFNELGDAELVLQQEAGLLESQFSEQDSQRLEALWAEGVWEIAEQISKDDVQRLRANALEAGMTY